MTLTGANSVLTRYWREGIVSGLVVLDGLVLLVFFTDAVRFAVGTGLSPSDAVGVAMAAATKGNSLGLAAAVLLFFAVGLPMAVALLSALPAIGQHWPQYLRVQGNGTTALHMTLSLLIACSTAIATAMEVLSGYARSGEGMRYSFISIWLSAVLLGKPVYAFYISPVIRKFLVRASAGKTKLSHVIEEVVTEEGPGAAA